MTMNNQLFKNFCKQRNLSSGSIKVYEHAINKYLEFNQQTLEELIDEADLEEEQGIRWKRRTLKTRLTNFRNYIIDEGYAKETISTMMKKVTTFYRHYEIEIHHLPRININSTVEIRIPTQEDLQLAISSSKPLMQAIILFLTSSGMSRVDMLKLTVGDFLTATKPYHQTNNISEMMSKLKDRDDVIPTFALIRTKTNKFHYTFCTPEATQYIVNYLYSRKDKLTLNSPLFKISSMWLSTKFGNLNETLQLGVTKGNNYNILRCHTLRKYHATTLRNDGLSIDIINSLQGKTKNKVDRAYYIDTPEQLKTMYTDHMNSLYITETSKYKNENEMLKEENTELKQKENEINELWEEINNIKKRKEIWDDL